jgi:low temperature requirement protein LtrA
VVVTRLMIRVGPVDSQGRLLLGVTHLGGPRPSGRTAGAAHYAERHQLVVLLALGESIVSIGNGAAQRPISVAIIAGALFAVVMAAAMWWNYFHALAPAAEPAVADRDGAGRAELATLGTYLHLGIVAGVLLVALGLQSAMERVADPAVPGRTGGVAIGGGLALYLLATALYWWRTTGRRPRLRLAAAAVTLALVPALVAVPALVSLALAAAVPLVLAAAERAPTASEA